MIRVGEMRDQLQGHFENLGLPVHEVTGPSAEAVSLGYRIMGRDGIVAPTEKKLHALGAAGRWLTRRPRTKGSDIERFMGHVTHVCLLRREMLSIFRHTYRFIQESYDTSVRLWPSVAAEIQWFVALLPLCKARLNRPLHSTVTASDACHTGYAVCSRVLSEEVTQPIVGLREKARYRAAEPARRARSHALESADVFSNPETVRPIDKPDKTEHYVPNIDFREIPDDILDPSDWQLDFAVKFEKYEDIMVLEARGVVAALRHKVRAKHGFHCTHLHLGDNLGLTLA